jgi:hypothetical protein
MRKSISALAVCGLVVGLVAVPGALAKPGAKTPKTHGGTVGLVAPSPAVGATSTTASGNVFSQASCRKNRTVHLTLTNADGSSAAPEVVATTGPNGDYSATVAVPAPVAPATTATYTLTANVDQAIRKSGKSKGKSKRARKHICAALTSAPVTVTATAVPAP